MTRDQVYLTIVEGWLRNNRGIVFPEGSVDDLCDRIAAKVERLKSDNERMRAILAGLHEMAQHDD
jgi:hypothetical protein